jgi:hypothetical protein
MQPHFVTGHRRSRSPAQCPILGVAPTPQNVAVQASLVRTLAKLHGDEPAAHSGALIENSLACSCRSSCRVSANAGLASARTQGQPFRSDTAFGWVMHGLYCRKGFGTIQGKGGCRVARSECRKGCLIWRLDLVASGEVGAVILIPRGRSSRGPQMTLISN